jgi:putative FmdB family regulatory protein
MPLYDYQCDKCGYQAEIVQNIHDQPKKKCPKCKKQWRRLFGVPSLKFIGSGFYVNDYGKNKEV